MDFITHLFDTSDFPARWSCGNWSSGHGWLHILSDLGVWSAYVAIPIVLCYFFFRKKHLPFRRIFLLFGAFILLCGMTHFMEALIFWWPAYRFAGLIKLFTAVASWATVFALVPIVPKVLAMRTPEELELEIGARKHAELSLQQANVELEQRVQQRTADLTRAVEALRDERELLQVTLGSIGDAVIVTDAQGRATFLNPVAEKLTGWSNADANGSPLEQVFHIVNEMTGDRVESPVTRALKEGVIVGLANHTILISIDGERRPIDDSAAPIRHKEGAIVGCVLVFRDVADRRRNEVDLMKSEERLRFVMDSMPQKIFTANSKGDVEYFNPIWTEFTHLPFDQIRNWGWSQFIHPDDVTDNIRAWRHSLETGEPYQFEHRFRRADGEYRWHITRAKAQVDADQNVQMWVGSSTEIHEQKQTANELRDLAARLSETDRLKNEFLATLAHELRNPLAPIRNGLQLIRMADGKPSTVEHVRIMMERQLSQLIRLVDDLMDVSRISRGKIELRKERFLLTTVVKSAVEASRPLIEDMQHNLVVTTPTQPVYLNADLTRLAQIFLNLLNNAAKYSEKGGRIEFIAEQKDVWLTVKVKDQGIGIAADQLPRIFEMFSQIDGSLEKSQGGLGIGLTLVKRLVEMHEGTVEARSQGPGAGSEFIVRLPVIVEVNTLDATIDVEVRRTPKGLLRILVVDDNRDSAESLSLMLKVMGNDIRTAYDGEEAVQAAALYQPEVVLLDIGMPKLNGYEACRRIRAQPWAKKVMMIALTGWGQEHDRQRSHEAGFHYHLVKPVDPVVLEKLLASVE